MAHPKGRAPWPQPCPLLQPRIRCGKASGRNSLHPGHPLMWTRGSGRKGRLAAVPRQKHTGPVTGARMQHACEVSTDERSRTAQWILWSNTSQIKCRRHAICHAGSSKGLGSHQNGALACGRHGRARSTGQGAMHAAQLWLQPQQRAVPMAIPELGVCLFIFRQRQWPAARSPLQGSPACSQSP